METPLFKCIENSINKPTKIVLIVQLLNILVSPRAHEYWFLFTKSGNSIPRTLTNDTWFFDMRSHKSRVLMTSYKHRSQGVLPRPQFSLHAKFHEVPSKASALWSTSSPLKKRLGEMTILLLKRITTMWLSVISSICANKYDPLVTTNMIKGKWSYLALLIRVVFFM